jgi:AAA family ATP:ADP antiporter
MAENSTSKLKWEQRFGFLAQIQPGEGRAVVIFCFYGFLVMFSYYMLKTLREPLLLASSSAEVKSYATAVIAFLLFFIVPLYGLIFRYVPKQQLSRVLTGILLVNLLLFYFLGLNGVDIGFYYYIWVGIFSVFITAQFWAFATDTFNVKTGQRIFPMIMAGVSVGGLLGPIIAGSLFQTAGPFNIMLITSFILLITIPVISWARNSVPISAQSVYDDLAPKNNHILGGFNVVMKSRYLLLVAALVVVLNWVNSTGEYILSEMVVSFADNEVANGSILNKGEIIAEFYGDFFSTVNAFSLLIQIFLVSRIFKWIGVHGALMVLPVVALIGYGLVVFVPIFSIIRAVKMFENCTDYSLMNTARQALFLPLNESEKYQSKIAIDTFFWRFGDLIQAFGIYLGLHYFGFEIEQFALMNMALCVLWIGLVIMISKHYLRHRRRVTIDEPPIVVRRIESCAAPLGEQMKLSIPNNIFAPSDVGDVITYSLREPDYQHEPEWLHIID